MKIFIFLFILSFTFLDAQNIDQLKSQLKASGMSKEQLKQVAKDRGLSDEQIQSEARSRGIDLNLPGKKEQDDFNNDNYQYEITDDLSENESLEENIKPIENFGLNSIKYYGYQIFQGDPNTFQSSTFGAVDPNYNIGPGDQIILMLWGESQFRQEITVDREGYVFLPEIGQIFVNGLNLEALEKKFFQMFSKVYSTLNPKVGKPTTFMDISLGNLRPLRIIVLGEVSQPGAYSVSPSTSLSSALYFFNGPTISGSLRDIRLLRKGKLIGSIDFYDYLLSGNVPNDMRLQIDDVIFVPARGKTVAIKGEISREGYYELKETEGLKDLISIAGNLSTTAYMKRAQINRIVPKENRILEGMDRSVLDINLTEVFSDNKDIELFDGDTIQIFPIGNLSKNYVTINGSSIARPGNYQLVLGMKLLDLINAADGLLNDAYTSKAHIRRINADFSTKIISINLKKLFEGDTDQNIKLQYKDELFVYNKNEINNVFATVNIVGPVKNPGSYVLDKEKTLGDLLILSGGFEEKVTKVKITIARSNINSFSPLIYNFPSNAESYINVNSLSDNLNEINNFLLFPHDIVSIYADPRSESAKSVVISGAVYHPGLYPILSNNEKVSDIIIRAGGLLPNAYPLASTFKRNNKIVNLSFDKLIKDERSKDNFSILPSDEIYISTKTNIVDIIGEVNQPGSYKFYDGYNLRQYLSIAGGISVNSEQKQIWVTYPNGTSKRLKKYFPAPKIYDSSVITVGTKPETEPINKTEFAKEIASIVSDFLQIALTLAILINTNNG